MGARTIWKGRVTLGRVEVPVRLYAAVEDRAVHFRLLHERDHVPVKQRMVHPETGEEVPPEEVRRGVEVESGRFVVLTDEELAAMEPPPDRTIELLAFVEPHRIAPPWYDRPYWLGPDGADEDYAALAVAMAKKGRIGIARWTMRKRRYVGALRAEGPWLMLTTLHHLGEVIPRDALGPMPKVEIDPLEAQLADQLVSVLAVEDLDLGAYRDEHRDRVLALIEKKARGEVVELERPEPKPAVTSLADSLRGSLEAVRKKVA